MYFRCLNNSTVIRFKRTTCITTKKLLSNNYLSSSCNWNSVLYLQLWIVFYSLSCRYIFSDSFFFNFQHIQQPSMFEPNTVRTIKITIESCPHKKIHSQRNTDTHDLGLQYYMSVLLYAQQAGCDYIYCYIIIRKR